MKPYLLLEQQNAVYKYHTFKPNTKTPDHAIKHAIEMIDLGNKYGMDMAFDIIPHDWSHTLVMAILQNGHKKEVEKIIKRLKESDVRVKIKNNRYPMWLLVADGIWDKIRILNSKKILI